MLLPSSRLKNKQSKRPNRALLATCFTLVPCLAYSSMPKMKATCSSETFANFQWTTCSFNPEDKTLHNHCIVTSNPTLSCDYMLCLPIANRPSFYVVFRIAHKYESKNLDSEIIYPKPEHQYISINFDNYLEIKFL